MISRSTREDLNERRKHKDPRRKDHRAEAKAAERKVASVRNLVGTGSITDARRIIDAVRRLAEASGTGSQPAQGAERPQDRQGDGNAPPQGVKADNKKKGKGSSSQIELNPSTNSYMADKNDVREEQLVELTRELLNRYRDKNEKTRRTAANMKKRNAGLDLASRKVVGGAPGRGYGSNARVMATHEEAMNEDKGIRGHDARHGGQGSRGLLGKAAKKRPTFTESLLQKVDEAKRGRPRIHAGVGDDPEQHIIVQLRKVVSMHGTHNHVRLHDGSHIQVHPKTAHRVLAHHDSLKTSGEKENFVHHAGGSISGFLAAHRGHVPAPAKHGAISLGGRRHAS